MVIQIAYTMDCCGPMHLNCTTLGNVDDHIHLMTHLCHEYQARIDAETQPFPDRADNQPAPSPSGAVIG